MSKDDKYNKLREQAEAFIKGGRFSEQFDYHIDVQKLIEDLHAYQVELEMQNQALKDSNLKLEAERERYKELYHNAPIAYFTVNKMGNIIQLNQAAADLIGLPMHRYHLTSLFPYLDKESKSEFSAFFQKVFSSDRRAQLDVIFRNTKGERLYTKLQTISYFDTHYDEQLCRLTITDISSEQVLAQREISAREQKFQVLFNNMNDAVGLHLLTPSGISNFIEVNDRACEIFGYSREEFMRMSPLEVLSAEALEAFPRMMKELQEHKHFSFETRQKNKAGQYIPIEVNAMLFEMNQQTYMTTVARDISERQEAQEALLESRKRYKLLSNLTFEGIVIHDDGMALDVNESFSRMTGYAADEVLQTNLILKLIHPDDIPIVADNVKKQYAYPYEVRAVKKDGTIFPVELEAYNTVSEGRTIRVAAIRDITERKRAQKALESSEERFRSIVENINDLIYILTSEGYFTYVSPNWPEMMGYSIEETIGQHFGKFVVEEDIPFCQDFLRKVLSTGEKQSGVEYRVIYKDKSVNWHFSNASPLKDAEGQVTSYIGVAREITERKAAEERVKQANEELKALNKAIEKEKNRAQHYLDIAGVLFIALDCQGKVILANKKAGEVLGYSESAIEGKLWFDHFIPRGAVENVRFIFSDIIKGEIAGREFEENYIITKEGDKRLIAWHNSLLYNEKGEIAGLLSSGEDITEKRAAEQALKESEDKFKGVFKYSNVGIALGNTEGLIIDANDEFQRLIGYSREELKKMNFEDFTHPDDLYLELDMYNSLLNNQRDNYRIEKRYINKAGEVIWVDLAITARRNKDNDSKIDLFIGMVLDINERKKVEAALRESREELKQLNATKDRFFSIIAHDLKSPFSSIMGFSEMLEERVANYDDDKMKKFVDAISSSAQMTYKLLENLLEWSRAQTGRIQYDISSLNLKQAIDEALFVHLSTAEAKGVSLTSTIEDDFFVCADRSTIATVLRNLISNAVKFTPKGGAVSISSSMSDKEIEISISDTGVGMSKEQIGKLFKIDQGISTEGTNKETGTGLGLILCKEFIEKNDGRISVESQKGAGSTFKFSLPLCEQQAGKLDQILTSENIPAISKQIKSAIPEYQTFLQEGIIPILERLSLSLSKRKVLALCSKIDDLTQIVDIKALKDLANHIEASINILDMQQTSAYIEQITSLINKLLQEDKKTT